MPQQELPAYLKSFFGAINESQPGALEDNGSVIRANVAIGRIAFWFERLRNTLDDREEHVLRRSAIERALERHGVLQASASETARQLIRELIWAHYLPNGAISERSADHVARIIERYQQCARSGVKNLRQPRTQLRSWLVGVLSAEIEENLAPPTRLQAITNLCYEIAKARIVVRDTTLADTLRKRLIYIACLRAIAHADIPHVRYHLLRSEIKHWTNATSTDPACVELHALIPHIESYLAHPALEPLTRAVRKIAVVPWVFNDVVARAGDEYRELLESEERLDFWIHEAYRARAKRAKAVIRRGAVRSTIYIFVSKVILALLIEIPVEFVLAGWVDRVPLLINILLPAVIMATVAFLIRVPGKENEVRLHESIKMIFSTHDINHATISVRLPTRRSPLQYFFFSIVWLLLMALVFGGLVGGLTAVGFSTISIAFFILFLCVVSFFGYRIRSSVRELLVVEPRESGAGLIFSTLTLPILRVGHWLSTRFGRFNVFLAILDIFIETPLKEMTAALEEWSSYMREKRDELG